jgi:uncharacterized protein (DUF1684 family)
MCGVSPLALSLVASLAGVAGVGAADWQSEMESWREEREAKLLAEDGWLSVAGLFWLEPGETRFGSGSDVDIPLRPPAPALAGRLERDAESVRLRLEPGVHAGLGEAGEGWHVLRTDADEEPDWLRFGAQRFHVIRRGERFGVRLVDDEAPNRARFEGLRWYALAEEWRVRARFVEHAEPQTLRVADVTGASAERESPGYALFELGGRVLVLHAVRASSPEQLFFIFRDATSGGATYGAGRFLFSPLPEDGELELDFNRAVSPPCAFTPYATCPLPPRVNWLDVAIEAGEQDPKLLH